MARCWKYLIFDLRLQLCQSVGRATVECCLLWWRLKRRRQTSLVHTRDALGRNIIFLGTSQPGLQQQHSVGSTRLSPVSKLTDISEHALWLHGRAAGWLAETEEKYKSQVRSFSYKRQIILSLKALQLWVVREEISV